MEEEITPAVVACGSEYTTSITRRGQLLTWGLGSRGELGHELPNAGEVGAPHSAATAGLAMGTTVAVQAPGIGCSYAAWLVAAAVCPGTRAVLAGGGHTKQMAHRRCACVVL